jgi:phosphoglycerate dehydrogenase-like enzyme
VRVLFTGSGWLPIVEMIAARLPGGTTLARWDRVAPLVEVIGDIDVLLPSNARITPEVIHAAKRLRLVQQPAAGTEAIDRATLIERGIPLCNAPGTNHISVAECALFLLLSLARRAPVAARMLRDRVVGEPLGIELAGRTLGVIGMGRAGTALAERASALGMTVRALRRGDSERDRMAFFAACDAISIHCPLTPETRGLVDARAFAAMREGAMLINVARGGVIDRDALVAALASDRLGGVGLDVHWSEPPDIDDSLYRDPRVVALPHVAGSTVEAFTRIAEVVVENIARLARGEPLLHRVV